MSNPIGALDTLAQAGFYMTCASGAVIPVAWAAAGEMYVMLGDPGALLEAGLEWLDIAQEIQDSLNANIELTNTLGATGWEGSDFDAFTDQAADLTRQLMVTMSLAYAVGTVLIVAAIAVSVAAAVIFAMGLGFAAYALAIITAMATGVGFLGPVEALMLSAEVYAITCEANLMALDTSLLTLFNVLAGTVAAALAAGVGLQVAFGNDEALGDLAQATVLGVPTIASGLVSAFFTKALGQGMKPPFGKDLIRALGIGIQATDADPIGGLTEDIDPTRW